MSEERTEINSLGEFGLIDHLTKNNETRNASTVLSIGDDAAVLDHFGKQIVVTTDMLIEGIHFDLMYTPLKHLGYKSVIVNISDVYAMNATPTQITVSIAFSNRFSLEALDEFYDGVYTACEKYGVDLIGGDTTSSQKGFMISVTAIGEVTPDKYVKRSTAKKGDLLCVSGFLGGAFLGLTILEREKRIYAETGTLRAPPMRRRRSGRRSSTPGPGRRWSTRTSTHCSTSSTRRRRPTWPTPAPSTSRRCSSRWARPTPRAAPRAGASSTGSGSASRSGPGSSADRGAAIAVTCSCRQSGRRRSAWSPRGRE